MECMPGVATGPGGLPEGSPKAWGQGGALGPGIGTQQLYSEVLGFRTSIFRALKPKTSNPSPVPRTAHPQPPRPGGHQPLMSEGLRAGSAACVVHRWSVSMPILAVGTGVSYERQL